MIVLSMEEFTTKRRTAQSDLEKRFTPVIEKALPKQDWDLIVEDALSIYSDLYYQESGERGGTVAPGFPSELRETLSRTKGDGDTTVARIANWLATRLLSEVAADAAIHDDDQVFLEWVDMHDDAVRPTHREASGQQRPPGDKFEVGEGELRFPGDTDGPIDEWINCRCTIRPVLAAEVNETFTNDEKRDWNDAQAHEDMEGDHYIDPPYPEDTALAISEKPWSGSASRFTDEQWKASCILHLADTLNKSDHKLPIKEPGGALSRAGVHAAASRFGSTDGPAEAKARAKASLRGAYKTLGEEPPDNLAMSWEDNLRAAAPIREGEPNPNKPSGEDPKDRSTGVMALPPKDHPVNKVGDVTKHVTLAYMKGVEDPSAIHEHVARVAKLAKGPAAAQVAGKGQLGPDPSHVLFLESHDLQALHDQVKGHESMKPHLDASPEDTKHAHFIPHMTVQTGGDTPPDGMDDHTEIPLDRLAVWHGDDQQEYPLGGDMKPDDKPAEEQEASTEGGAESDTQEWSPTPWHGVLAPEGIWSGDRRRFAEGSLSARPFPLPLTWQKTSDDGHKGNITVAKIERGKMIGNLFHASGTMLSIPEADEFTGLLGEFGRFGVSVDADSIEMSEEESAEGVTFSKARISSACAVPIPAFAEAYVALGEAPEEWGMDEVDQVADESLVASGVFSEAMLAQFKRGPGWVTNPEATRRIHAYWTSPGQPGYAKVNWGVSGDFNRCRIEVGEEIGENSPEDLRFINNICAQWHHDALGIWPGQEKVAADVLELKDETPAPALSLVAAGAPVHRAPAAWFKDPEFKINDGRMAQDRKGNWGCAATVTDDGEFFGHAALWNTCHIAYGTNGECVIVPKDDDFSYFNVGQVVLDDGTRANTGVISLGGGHADEYGGVRGATSHYDSTSAAVADVTAGADEFGIWMHGRTRPGVTPEQVAALMASKVSGDWREVQGALTLVAVLAVNVPGFGVPRARVAASNDGLSMVAAGVFDPVEPGEDALPSFDVATLAVALADEMERRDAQRQRWARLKEERGGVRV